LVADEDAIAPMWEKLSGERCQSRRNIEPIRLDVMAVLCRPFGDALDQQPVRAAGVPVKASAA
jgi:hypothetical protein